MEILTFIVGLLLGVLVSWLVAKARRAQALAEAQAQVGAEMAALKERLQLREQELGESRHRQTTWDGKETALESELSEMKGRCRELQARMDEEQKNAADKIAQLQSLEGRLNREFQALSAKALREKLHRFGLHPGSAKPK